MAKRCLDLVVGWSSFNSPSDILALTFSSFFAVFSNSYNILDAVPNILSFEFFTAYLTP